MARPGGARIRAAALFVGFVTTFLGMMGVAWALLLGGPWPLLLLGVWVAQGAHEWHHLGKSLARRAYYPGTVTGVLFVVVVGLWYFPAWSAALALDSWILVAWGAAQPVFLALFYLEDRAWLRKLSPEAAERIAPRAGLSGVAQPG